MEKTIGVILYEMLSGLRTFSGDSAIEVMNAILKEEPPELSETNTKISLALDKIVRRYEFFFTAAPLNKLGGVPSPPNALAIK